jgi:hypothetical protein
MSEEPLPAPGQRRLGYRVGREREKELVGLLLAALDFVRVRVLLREETHRQDTVGGFHRLREVLPEVRHAG